MENSILTDLHVDSEAHGFLSETARWARFIAIVGFIISGLMVFFGFISFVTTSAVSDAYSAQLGDSYRTGVGMSRGIILIMYIVIAVVMIMPNVYMLRFSRKMKEALTSSDQYALNLSFGSLKSLYKFYGVLLIIWLCFIVLAFVISLVAGAMFLR